MSSSTPVEAALAYRQLAFSVVPIAPGQKTPPKDYSWTRLQTELPTPAQISIDFKRHAHAGVAIVTGRVSGIVVLDVDPSKTLPDDLAAIHADLEGRFKNCPRVRTGGGGFHLFFTAPAHALPNAVNLRPGFDIRAEGGLVVAPPSRHQTGRFYKWEVPFSRKALLPLPTEYTPEIPEEKTKGHAHWIEEALGGVPDGGRNDTCARLAGFFLGKGVPASIVSSVLLTSYAPRCKPPMKADEVERTVFSVAKREKFDKNKKKTATFDVTHIDDFMATHADSITEWVIDEWLPEGAVTFLVAPPGHYKTWLLLDLALSLATATPFLGQYQVKNPGPVILVQQEDHKGGVASRFGKIWRSRFTVKMPKEVGDEIHMPEARLPIWVHETRSLRLDSQESIAALGMVVDKLRPRAVLIDPLYSTLSTDDFMAAAAEQMLALKTLRDKFGTAFVIAHHTRKKENEGRHGAWGSQFLNAFIETGWQIRGTDQEGIISVLRHHKVAAPLPAISLEWKISDAEDNYAVHVAGVEVIGDVTQAILTALAGKPLTMSELADATQVHRSTISRKLAAMAADGLVHKEGQIWKLMPEHFS